MVRLIAGSIRDRGDSVLIVTRYAGTMLIGFVARSSLADFLGRSQPMNACMAFVEEHIGALSPILLEKSRDPGIAPESLACIEITSDDIRNAGIKRRIG